MREGLKAYRLITKFIYMLHKKSNQPIQLVLIKKQTFKVQIPPDAIFLLFFIRAKNEQKYTSNFGFFGYKNRAGAAFSAVPTPDFM